MDYQQSEDIQQQQDHEAYQNEQILVEVGDPKIVDALQKYTVYSIKGSDKNGEFDVPRRFNDFLALRTIMVYKWPGCYIPPLPPKKALGNLDQSFIDNRKYYLDQFCRKISYLSYLWYSDEFQIFLRSVQQDIEKQLSLLPKINNEEIITKYQNTFSDLSGKEINNQITSKISDFNNFLKRVIPMVDNFKRIAKNIMEAKKNKQDSIVSVLTQLIPEYEKEMISEYGGGEQAKLIIANAASDQVLDELLNQYKEILNKNQYNELYEHIRIEQKELEAFQETFQQREKYELQRAQAEQRQKDLQIELQSVLAGKTSLKNMFSKANKEDIIQKLQVQIDQSNKDIENSQFICDILTVLLGYNEIDRFKVQNINTKYFEIIEFKQKIKIEKQQQYYSLVKKIIQFELELSRKTQEFWEKIQSNYYLL